MGTANEDDKKFESIMDAIAKGATHIVASPNTIQRMIDKGYPIENRFITYEEYIERLYEKRKKEGFEMLRQLSKVDDSIADSVISDIYEEIRSSLAFGIFTSVIFNSILLLEYAMRSRLYEERLKHDPNAAWEEMEKLDMGALIPQLRKNKIITVKEQEVLNDFSEKMRNPYLHINILKLTKGIFINKVMGVDVENKKEVNIENEEANKYRFLWFGAKRYFDKTRYQYIVDFCIHWTNKLRMKIVTTE